MIYSKALECNFRPAMRYMDGAGITLDAVRNALSEEAKRREIRIAFSSEQLETGGMQGRDAAVENCLVLYHPEHAEDYFHLILRIDHQRGYAYIAVDGHGKSQLLKAGKIRQRINTNVQRRLRAAMSGDESAQGKACDVESGDHAGVNALTGANAQAEEEACWYTMVSALLDGIFPLHAKCGK